MRCARRTPRPGRVPSVPPTAPAALRAAWAALGFSPALAALGFADPASPRAAERLGKLLRAAGRAQRAAVAQARRALPRRLAVVKFLDYGEQQLLWVVPANSAAADPPVRFLSSLGHDGAGDGGLVRLDPRPYARFLAEELLGDVISASCHHAWVDAIPDGTDTPMPGIHPSLRRAAGCLIETERAARLAAPLPAMRISAPRFADLVAYVARFPAGDRRWAEPTPGVAFAPRAALAAIPFAGPTFRDAAVTPTRLHHVGVVAESPVWIIEGPRGYVVHTSVSHADAVHAALAPFQATPHVWGGPLLP